MQITISLTPLELYELMVLTNKTLPASAGLPELVKDVAEEQKPADEETVTADAPAAEEEKTVVSDPPKVKRRTKAEIEAAKAKTEEPAPADADAPPDEPEGLTEPKVRAKVALAMLNDPGRAQKDLLVFGSNFSSIPTAKWPELMEALAWC